MSQTEINERAINFAKTKLKERFILGKNWVDVPINQDMLKSGVWIYNTEILDTISFEDTFISFKKFDHIPDQAVTDRLEWKTIDCLSFARWLSCRSWSDTLYSLQEAVIKEKLNIDLLVEYAHDYGDKHIIDDIRKTKILFDSIKRRRQQILINQEIDNIITKTA